MKLVRIDFGDNLIGEDVVPERVTVEMTRDEALFLAHWIGHTNNIQRDEIMADGGELGSDIYDCLVGDVFNRYWDDGVSAAMRER